MKFVYSVRRLFSQGVLNDALQQPQTYPLASAYGNGGRTYQDQLYLQPASGVMNRTALVGNLFGSGSFAGSPDLDMLMVGKNDVQPY